MKIALTEVLREGRAGATVVHLTDPIDDELTLCSQHIDGCVSDRWSPKDVDCMTCLVHASKRRIDEGH